MFCQKCGSKINENASFCFNCGAKNDAVSLSDTKPSTVEKGKSDYNRDALKQHLSDVRALECIKLKLSESVKILDARIEKLGIPQDFGYPPKRCLDIYDFGFLVFSVISFLGGLALNAVVKWLFSTGSNFIFIIGLIVSLICLVLQIVISVSDESKFREREATYNKRKRDDKERVERENVEKEELKPIIEEQYGELCEVEDLLKKAYSVDIIPSQFRNLYAVYYLYEFISTSNESFSNALLQCNLDEIKRQLATIIEQQQQIIINQAVIIAQNEQLMQQNNRQLRHLAQIETNSELSAKYSQIAAVNAEACAWIGVANYIKD